MKLPRNFGLDRFSGLYLWAAFIAVFGIWSPTLFLTRSTMDSIASAQAVTGILSLAVLVPIVSGTFDLSVGATANLAAIFCINLQTQHNMSILVSILLALLAGIAIGLANGFLVVVLKVNSFIATLGMGSVVLALLTMVSGNIQPTPPLSLWWPRLTNFSIYGFQVAFFLLLLVAIVVWWYLEHTPAGRYSYAIGCNAEAVRLSGVPVGRWVWLSLIASGFLSALAGITFGSLLGPSLTFGPGLLLPAFAAVFLGSTQLKPGRFNVWGTIIAIYVLATGVQGFQYVTGVQWLSDMFDGVALIAAVAFAIWRQQVSASRSETETYDVSRSNAAAPTRDENALLTETNPSTSLNAEDDLGESAPIV